MRRHCLGPGYGISTADLCLVQVDELSESELRGRRNDTVFPWRLGYARSPRDYVFVFRWVVLHTNVLKLAVESAKCVGMCVHHNAEEGEMLQLIVWSLNACVNRLEGPREPRRRICRRCNFEYQLEVLDTGSDGLAIVITK